MDGGIGVCRTELTDVDVADRFGKSAEYLASVANASDTQCFLLSTSSLIGVLMTDRHESQQELEHIFRDLTKLSVMDQQDSIAGEFPLLHLARRPTMTPVPRPHNPAALASSVFANANLPVMNVHAKTRRLKVRGH